MPSPSIVPTVQWAKSNPHRGLHGPGTSAVINRLSLGLNFGSVHGPKVAQIACLKYPTQVASILAGMSVKVVPPRFDKGGRPSVTVGTAICFSRSLPPPSWDFFMVGVNVSIFGIGQRRTSRGFHFQLLPCVRGRAGYSSASALPVRVLGGANFTPLGPWHPSHL